jgi:hypothetical protein
VSPPETEACNGTKGAAPIGVKRGMIRVAYGYYDQEPQPERPVIVTVVGILGIVAGGLTLLALPLSLLQFSGGFPFGGAGGQLMQDPAVRNWTIGSTAANAVLASLNIVAGIGLLAMRRWAWLLAIGVLAAGALWQIVGAIVMQALDIMGKMWASMGAMGDPNMAAMMQRMTGIMTVFGMIFWLAVYATLIILLTLPNVRKAFANR